MWNCGPSAAELANTFIGHLAPLSRVIKLTRGCPLCVLGGGVVYPDISEWREPMASVKLKKDGGSCYVSSDPARMPWRELASVLAVREKAGRKSALALKHLESLPDEKEFILWTGGLYAEKAKEIDAIEWKARLSDSLLEEPVMQKYENAIECADKQRSCLYFATAEYAQKMKSAAEEKKVKTEQIEPYSRPAERIYWDILANPLNQKLVQDVDSPTYLDDWKKATRKAAEEAYRRACSAMTARQMEAFAQGFSKLWIPEDSKTKMGR